MGRHGGRPSQGESAISGENLVRRAPDEIFGLVYRLLNPLGFVAFKMGRRQGARRAHI
jgi:hypothetical protein